MSTLQVTTITTVNNTTPLILATGNTGGGQIVVQAANNDIQFNGNVRLVSTVTGDGSGLTFPSSNVANAAFGKANTALQNASGTLVGTLYTTTGLGVGSTTSLVGGSLLTVTGNTSGAWISSCAKSLSSNTAKLGIYIDHNSNDGSIYNGIGFRGQSSYDMYFGRPAGAADDLIISRSNYDTTELFRFTAGGKLGIGNASPSYTLDVAGSLRALSSSEGVQTTGDTIGRDLLAGKSSVATCIGYVGSLAMVQGTNFSLNTTLDLSLQPYGGNVVIGSSSSSTYKLDVSGVVRLGYGTSQGNPNSTDLTANAHTLLSGTGGNYLAFGQYGSGSTFAQWIQSAYQNPTTATYNLVLQPLGGNVGVGTSTPATTLDVNGSIKGTVTSKTVQNTTSGTTVDFTGIPSWAKKIIVMFNGVSTNGGSAVIVQLGSGSFTTSGYVSHVGAINGGTGQAKVTAGFAVNQGITSTSVTTGNLMICNQTGNTWVASGVLYYTNNDGAISMVAGVVTIGGAIDRVRITSVTPDTFDAGSVNILYEG